MLWLGKKGGCAIAAGVRGRKGAGRGRSCGSTLHFRVLCKRVSYGDGMSERWGTGKLVDGGETLNDDHQAAALRTVSNRRCGINGRRYGDARVAGGGKQMKAERQ